MKKRIISALLAAVMLIAMVPTAAFAENENTGDAVKRVANETDLKKAVTTEGAYIVLTDDIELTAKLEVAKSVTIDGGNHTITATSGVTGHVINVSANDVTIKNLTVDGGKQNVHGLHFYKAENGKIENIVAKNNVKTGLTVNASTVTAKGTLEFINNGWESLPNSLNVGFGQNITGDIDSRFDFSDATLIGVSAVYAGSEDLENAGDHEITITSNENYFKTEQSGGMYYLPAVAKIGETKYATLADAVEAAGTDDIGTKIVLTSDITLTETVTIDKSVTIDLNGNTITISGDEGNGIGIASSKAEINVLLTGGTIIDERGKDAIATGDNTIYIEGCADVTTSDLTVKAYAPNSKASPYYNYLLRICPAGTGADAKVGSLTLDDGTKLLEIASSNENYGAVGITAMGPYSNGNDVPQNYEGVKVTVKDGVEIKTTGYALTGNGTKHGTTFIISGSLTSYGSTGIYHPQMGNVTVSDTAVITGKNTGIEVRAGDINITGGTITGLATPTEVEPNGNGTTSTGAGVAVVQHTTKLPINVNISGGTINGYSAVYEKNIQNNPQEDIDKVNIEIRGGSFNAINEGTVAVYSENEDDFITGGTFSADPKEYVASGYYVSGTNPYRVYRYVPDTTPSNPDKTETVTNPDGSTTTTVTKPDGTVTETTKQPDGSTTVTTTKPDGSSVTTVDNKDGSSSKTTVSAEGKTESDVKLPSAVVDNAEKNGEAVELPIPEVTASKDADKAPEVTVDLLAGRSVKVEIPVDNVNAGVVAVLVHADGTEEIIKTSVPTENGIEVKVEDGATLKIVDNSKDFVDVAESHWGADAVDFAASREIFDGTSETTFEPETAMTRAMVVTVLARLDGVDTAGDVWYEAGAEWAKENGISDGTNLNAMVSREQLVTMLYRYAGSPEVEGQLVGYPDAESVSGYAEKAMIWAVENGIITGADGKIAPQGDATRVQVAAILMRFIDLMQ